MLLGRAFFLVRLARKSCVDDDDDDALEVARDDGIGRWPLDENGATKECTGHDDASSKRAVSSTCSWGPCISALMLISVCFAKIYQCCRFIRRFLPLPPPWSMSDVGIVAFLIRVIVLLPIF